ncbi:MAG: hypothetical protein JW900_04425, partial [Anaerolineae bacterium]|nr:hypothetical protein [Anaerolineae bacterium]
LRRVPGDNFYLRLVGTRDERSVTAWYDAMKATLRLEAVHDPAAALEPGEVLYLASGPAELVVEEGDPLFFAVSAGSGAPRLDKRQVEGRPVGRGRLFLTDRRLVWRDKDRAVSWPLARLNSAHAFLNHGVMFLIEMRLYTARFLQESLLKWVTYVAMVSAQVEAETGHRITTSNF